MICLEVVASLSLMLYRSKNPEKEIRALFIDINNIDDSNENNG